MSCLTIGYTLTHRAAANDQVTVLAGTYPERLNPPANITLAGAGTAAVIVDGGAAGPVLTIGGRLTVTLRTLTLRNGSNPLCGGGIVNNGTLTASFVVINGKSGLLFGGESGARRWHLQQWHADPVG